MSRGKNLELDPICEVSSHAYPARLRLVVVIGPADDSFIPNLRDRYAREGNRQSNLHRAVGHLFRRRHSPFGNGAIPALEGRNYFDFGVWELLARLFEELAQTPLVRKLEIERLVGVCEVVAKGLYEFSNFPFTEGGQDGSLDVAMSFRFSQGRVRVDEIGIHKMSSSIWLIGCPYVA